MPHMLERLIPKKSNEEEYPPYVYLPDFDPVVVREMEDEYIRLGYISEEDRMKIPREIENADRQPPQVD